MTDSAGAVYDLGYEPYEGDRRGRSGARRTLVADGVRKVLGLRRKARRKIMPFALVGFSVIPTIVFVGFSFVIPDAAGEIALPAVNSDVFGIGGTVVMLFTALAAPELLVPDRSEGVLSMLSSRPLTPADYVLARFAGILAVVGGFLLLPQLFLFIGQAGTDPDGLVAGIADHAELVPKILLVSAVYTLAFVPIGFVVAAFSKRKAIASSIYIATLLGLMFLAQAVVLQASVTGGRWLALISPINTVDAINKWAFVGTDPESLLAIADIHPSVAIGVLVVFAAASTAVVLRRYRRLM